MPIPDTGHFALVGRPARVAELILEAVSGIAFGPDHRVDEAAGGAWILNLGPIRC